DHAMSACSFRELTEDQRFRDLRVAEINSAGHLHHFLRSLPRLAYSEYGSTRPGVRSEDLTALSYPDKSFDLVITSETLEHVPDIDRALREIGRVLKPGGAHAFTVPVVTAKPATRQRASLREGRLVHDLPPSYHGPLGTELLDRLVIYEFGS